MKIKNTLVIISCVLFLAIIFSVYYFQFNISGIDQNNKEQDSKDLSDFLAQKRNLPKVGDEVSLIAVGDISYSRAVGRMVDKQNDINYPFLKVKDYLKSADLVFGNLETPITKGREISDFEMVFRSDPGTEKALKDAGFSILSLANNHTPNFGESGLKDTFRYLDTVGIKYVGAGKNIDEANELVYIEKKGIKFAFLAYNDSNVVDSSYEAGVNRFGTAFMKKDQMVEAVKKAKQKSDFVIVSMHSGVEYIDKPNDSQINFSHSAIDAGADLVIGHHPHVVQTMEQYKGKYIFYSLGNFIFDQPQLKETKEGLIVKIYFKKDRVNKISLFPTVTENFTQPKVIDDGDAIKILQRLKFLLSKENLYSWNYNNNNFDKSSVATIYNKSESGNFVNLKKEKVDLDNDSLVENYVLENGKLTVSNNLKSIWQSPSDWWVDNFIIADSNNDGVKDINLSVWKPGNFGLSKPFWVKENDMSIKNHFFIFDLIDGVLKPVWQSSNLEAPNCEFYFEDINGDQKNELVVLEGDYSQKPMCNGNYVAVWKWNDWGFSNEWRSEKGSFSNLEILKVEGKNLILVDSR